MEEEDNILYIGVVGTTDSSTFNSEEVIEAIEHIFDDIEEEYHENCDSYCVVSGLTNMGVWKHAYEIASERGYKTIGIAPNEANDYEHYPVDETVIIGKKFGDESSMLIDSINILVKIGGGDQSDTEMNMAEEAGLQVMEYEFKGDE